MFYARPSLHPLFVLTLLSMSLSAWSLDNRNVADASQAPIIRENQPFLAHITVRNPHDRAVKVKLLDPTCSCATLDIADKFLLPKGTTTLTIAVDNLNRSGPIRVGVSIYLTDAELEAIEVETFWQVRPTVQVDAVEPGKDPLVRSADQAWHDVYRYVTKVRPDEPNRLRKRMRLSCPPEEMPAGGLQILGIDYPGKLWRFTPTTQTDGSILITATAQAGDEGTLAIGDHKEVVVVRTNHPDKPKIDLEFQTFVSKNAGQRAVDLK